MHIADDHFVEIIHFLTMGMVSKGYTSQQNKELVVHASNFSVVVGHLYKMSADEILQRYVLDFEHGSILSKAHVGDAGGHYAGKATA